MRNKLEVGSSWVFVGLYDDNCDRAARREGSSSQQAPLFLSSLFKVWCINDCCASPLFVPLVSDAHFVVGYLGQVSVNHPLLQYAPLLASFRQPHTLGRHR